jgi:hypothetical protein
MKKAKKFLVGLLAFVVVCVVVLVFVLFYGDKKPHAGTGNGGGIHRHIYDQEITDEDYLKSTATCTAKATYYKSCKCGAKGTATFEYGKKREHTDNNDGTCSVCLQKYYSVGLEYELSDDGTYYKVTGIGECTDTDLMIPSTHNNLQVKQIGSGACGAFYGCDSLTSVTIPDSITMFGDEIFYGCDSLPSVYYTGDIASWCAIEFGIGFPLYNIVDFYIDNEKVVDLIVPDGIRIINDYAFYGYPSLASVTLPDSITRIGVGTFGDCNSLTSVTIPDSVTTVGSHSFENCINLTYNIKGNLKYLGNENNPYIYLVGMVDKTATSVTIDNACKFIGANAFNYCINLTNVAIPNSVTMIGDSAFAQCYDLTSVTIPNSVTTIGNRAFSSCNSLASVTIPDSVTAIGVAAFYGCESLTSVTIGNSVATIRISAFERCDNLTSITFTGTVAEWNEIEISGEWNVSVPATKVVCSDGEVAL